VIVPGVIVPFVIVPFVIVPGGLALIDRKAHRCVSFVA
jgi:hypothetical protein